MNTKTHTILSGHVSQDTAYVVDDYPYGYTLHCKIRYWLDFKKSHGVRLMSQTTNPKKHGEVWNKVKGSTYQRFGGCMFLDEKGHVQWTGLNEYSNGAEAKAWQDTYASGCHPEALPLLDKWVRAKIAYDAARNTGDPLMVGFAQAVKEFSQD